MCIDVEKSQVLAGSARERVSSLLRCCQCLSEGLGKKKKKSMSKPPATPFNRQEVLTLLRSLDTNPPTNPPRAPWHAEWLMLKKKKGNKASTKREADTSSPNTAVLDVRNSHFHKSPVGFLFIFHTFQGFVFLERTRYEFLEAPALWSAVREFHFSWKLRFKHRNDVTF